MANEMKSLMESILASIPGSGGAHENIDAAISDYERGTTRSMNLGMAKNIDQIIQAITETGFGKRVPYSESLPEWQEDPGKYLENIPSYERDEFLDAGYYPEAGYPLTYRAGGQEEIWRAAAESEDRYKKRGEKGWFPHQGNKKDRFLKYGEVPRDITDIVAMINMIMGENKEAKKK
tara:strand:+ start:933 stop:1463 length:531 start_codon:yes stop_codon:yes gene_type:complete